MLRVTVLELPARWDGAGAALREVEELLATAPTDLVVLPEMALVGYVSPAGDFDLTRFAEPLDGPTVRQVSAIARRHDVHVVAPLVLSERTCLYNASILVSPDRGVVAVYRKRHPWLPERWATPGALPLSLARVGDLEVALAICYDGHFIAEDAPEVLARADLLIFTSAWVDDEDSRIPLLESIAGGFGVAIANANWGPGVVEIPGQGGSCIIDASARVLARVPGGGRRADAVVHRRSG